ncbi:MAG: flagellar hook-basal body complex protein FliE [Magnetococcales bacterium]|nr:flagellar hook-basal body complex protein FliE [Magnetococcales bacterium]
MTVNSINQGLLMPPLSSGKAVPGGDGAVGTWEDFSVVLARQIKETDRMQKDAGELSKRAMLGNAGVSLHEAQIATAEADLHLRLLLQVRNKALESYKEIMSMPV